MLADIVAAFRARSTSSLAISIACALVSVAGLVIANTPYGSSLGAIPYVLFLFQLFAYELLVLGVCVVILLTSHYAFCSDLSREILRGRSIRRGSDVLLGLSARDRQLGRVMVYAAGAVCGAVLIAVSVPWIKSTGIFLRDDELEQSYRWYLLLGAYDAEAQGEYALAIDRLMDFKRKFPDRAEMNNVDPTIKELSALSRISQEFSDRANETEKRRGFAVDILDLRVAAVAAMPSAARIDQLALSLLAGNSFIKTASAAVDHCKAGRLDISTSDIGKTLVAFGVVSLPERIIPVAKGASAPAICELLRFQPGDSLEATLKRQWNLDEITRYKENISKFTHLERAQWRPHLVNSHSAVNESDQTDGAAGEGRGREIDELVADEPSASPFDSTIGPVDFSSSDLQAAAPKSTGAGSKLDVFVSKDLGILLCWKGANTAADVVLAGSASDLMMTKAQACRFAMSGRIPRLNTQNTEILEMLTAGLAELLEKSENGEKVSSLPKEASRRALCRALLTLTKGRDKVPSWPRHCQLEALLHSN